MMMDLKFSNEKKKREKSIILQNKYTYYEKKFYECQMIIIIHDNNVYFVLNFVANTLWQTR